MGALTSKPYAFSARPWELDHVDSFDFFDVLGSSIRLDFRGPVLMRVLPRLNSSLNEDWIADKIRFSLVDGCFRQRVTKCYTRIGVQKFSTFGSRTWFQVSTQVKKYLCSLSKINFLIALGCFVDLEFCVSLKNYIVKSDKNFNFFSFLGFLGYPTHDWRFDFLFSSDQLEFLEQSSVVVFCGFNPATVPVLNVRFRRMSQKNPLTLFFNFGSSHHKFGYDVVNVGSTWQSLIQFFEGRSRLCSLFCRSTKKLIVVGDEFYSMFSSFVPNSLLESLRSKFLSSLTIFYVPRFTSTPSFLELGASSNVSFENHVPFLTSSPSQLMLDLTGMKPSSTASINFFNFGHEFVSLSSMLFNSSRFYSVSHATERLFDSDCILSSAAHLEKISSFINITGRLQTAGSYLISPLDARSEWEILTMLLFWTGIFPYHALVSDRSILSFFFKSEVGGSTNSVRFNRPVFEFFSKTKVFEVLPISSRDSNFDYYLSDYISRSSPLMALRSKVLKRLSIF